MEIKVVNFDDFSAGQWSGIEEEKVPKGGFVKAQNCLIDVDGSIYRAGKKRIINSLGNNTEDYAINYGILNKTDGAHIVVVATSQHKLYRYNQADNSWINISVAESLFGQTSKVRFLSYEDLLWIIDGRYAYTYDGTTLTRVDSGATPHLWDLSFDGASLIEEAQGIIYLAGYSLDPAKVMYSRYTDDAGYFIKTNDTQAWVTSNVFYLPQEGQTITALKKYGDALLLFTQDKTFVLTGNIGSSNTVLTTLFDIGCVSQESVRVLDRVLYWVARDGIYSYDGSKIEKKSIPIKNYFNENFIANITLNRQTIDDKTTKQFKDYPSAGFANCNYDDITDSIVFNTYPTIEDGVETIEYSGNTSFTNDNNYITTIAQPFMLKAPLKGKIRVRLPVWIARKGAEYPIEIHEAVYDEFGYLKEPSATVIASSILSFYSSYNDFYHVYQDIKYNETEIDLGTTVLEPNTVYYIVIKNINILNEYMYNNISFKILNTIIKQRGVIYYYYDLNHPDGLWTDQKKSNFPIGMFIYPIETSFETKIYHFQNVGLVDVIHAYFDTDFVHDEVPITSSSGYTVEYRFSTVSEDDVGLKNYKVFTNHTSLYLEGVSGTVPNLYLQFKIYMKKKNIYDKHYDNYMQQITCKFDRLNFDVYTNVPPDKKLFFATTYRNYYMISLSEEGFSKNQKIFVLNNGNAWTYFNINSDCLWEYENVLYISDNTNSAIYVIDNNNPSPIFDLAKDYGSCDLISGIDVTTMPLKLSNNFTSGYIIYEITSSNYVPGKKYQLFYIGKLQEGQSIDIRYNVKENPFIHTYHYETLFTMTNSTSAGSIIYTPIKGLSQQQIDFVFHRENANDPSPELHSILIYDYDTMEVVLEFPFLELKSPDQEKYMRKVYPDIESDMPYDLYYRTEKMTFWRRTSRTENEKRVSLIPEHGQKFKFKLVSGNSRNFKLKHFDIFYKERKYR